MKIQDVMTTDVMTIQGSATVREAARIMSEAQVGALPVTNDTRLLGMLTDRDIVLRVVSTGDNPEQVTVADVMSNEIRYCFADQECSSVARNMAEQEILRMPVVDRQQRLIGIVTAGDLQSRAGTTDPNDAQRGTSRADGARA